VKITVTPGRKIMGRLAKGEDLLAALSNCAREHGISLGEVQAIGAVSQARVGYYNQAERKYYSIDLKDPREILSLTGNISLKDGEPMVHAHITLSGDDGRAVGGIWPRAPWSLPANSPSRNTGRRRRWCGSWTSPPGCGCGPRSKGMTGPGLGLSRRGPRLTPGTSSGPRR
jgi:predicted DNA-binding protein with PD1-like motif